MLLVFYFLWQPLAVLASGGALEDNFRDRSRDVLNPGVPTANDHTGAFIHDYPIAVPPGRNDVTTPKLSLVYNNQTGDDISPFGYAWSDNIPFIERIAKTGPANLYSESYFYSTLSGELATTSSSTQFFSKVDDGNFYSYTFNNNVWVVVDKFGTKYTFGTTTSGRLDNPNDNTQIYRWMLQEVRDSNDNYIKYEYYKNAGQIYPYLITYSGHGSTDGIMQVEFLRESRTDVSTSSVAAFPIVSNYRIYEIDAKVNGSWVRKYQLAYTSADNGRRSLLSSVTESARDESLNTTSLPATTFLYATSTKTYGSYSSLNSPLGLVALSGSSRLDNGVRVVDINGDGLPDIVQKIESGGTYTNHAYINNGSGYADNSTWYLPIELVSITSTVRYSQGVEFVDINGDGLTDIVQAVDFGGGLSATTYINNGTGFTASSTWALPVAMYYRNSNGTYDNSVRLADINGDGLVDVIEAREDASTSTRRTYINTGRGFTLDPNWVIPLDFITVTTNGVRYDQGVRLADINGDGLVDVIQSLNAGTDIKHTFINTGKGFSEDSQWVMPLTFSNRSGTSAENYDTGVRLADINGDGLVDVVQSIDENGTWVKNAYINNGAGFTLDSTWNFPLYFISHTASDNRYDQGVVLADINGDGVADFVQAIDNGSISAQTYLSNSTKADSLNRLNMSKGSKIRVTYKGSPQFIDGTTVLNPKLPLNLQMASSVANDNGLGVIGTTTYSYSGGSYYFKNFLDRKFAGFNIVTETNPSGHVTKTYHHQGNATDSTNGEYSDDIAKLGKIYRLEIYDSSSNLLKKVINKWDEYAINANSNFVKNIQSIESSYEGGGTHKDKATQYIYNDANGNLSQRVDLGEVNGSNDGTLSDTGTDSYTTNYSYASTSGSSVIGQPYLETTLDSGSNKVKESRYYYDNLSLGSVGNGNLTKIEKLKSGSTYVSLQKTYNSYGLVTQDIDGRGKQTNYVYDSNNLHVATSTNALSQSTGYVYNLTIGKVKRTNDPIGNIFETIYDGFGRALSITQPSTFIASSTVTKVDYVYTDTGLPKSVRMRSYLDGSNYVDTYSYLDGFGRVIQERTQSETSGMYAVKDQVYDARGNLVAKSLSYFSTGASSTPVTPVSSLYAYTTYDPLNRVGTQVTAVGTTTHTYSPWKETITRPDGKTKDLYSDAYGNLSRVDEHNGASTYTTTYTYDGLNDLIKITDANSNIRNFSYDLLGRRTSAEDLHASADGTFGSWTYTYDDSNNLTQVVDPKSQTTNYTYDDINRVLTEDYIGQSGTEATYAYDACSNGIGRLCSAGSASATTTYQYDPLGNIKQETKVIDSNSYTTSKAYDRQGNVTSVTYPDNSQVAYNYNSAGFIESILRNESGSTSTSVVQDFDYSPMGQVMYQSNANNTETYFTYDPNELYRLVSKTTLGPISLGGMGMMSLSGANTLTAKSQSDSLIKSPDGSATYKNPIELPLKKTRLSDTYLLGYTKNKEPIYKTNIYLRDVNYPDLVTKQLKRIDVHAKEDNRYWSFEGASYSEKLPKDLSDPITFTNQGQDIYLSVPNLSKRVQGRIASTTTALYDNVFASGVNLVVKAGDNQIRKNIVIDSYSALSDIVGSTTYDVPFKITSNRDIELIAGDKKLSVEKTIVSSDMVKLVDSQGVASYIYPPVAEDSSRIGIPDHMTSINVRYELKNDGIYATKLIPAAWLKNATYPVTADLVVSGFAGVGDGSVTARPYPGLWSTQHSDTTGLGTYYTSTDFNTYVSTYNTSTGFLQIVRGFMPVDTSVIPATATVTAATLKMYITYVFDDINDGNSYISVLQGFQAATSSLVAADIDNCGDAITNPTKGSSDVDITSLTPNTYASFPLNSTGLSWISRTGYTKLCYRLGHDVVNSIPTNTSNSWKTEGIGVASAEATGTSTDPYLEVTYTLPNTAPTAPTSLLTQGLTNPTNLSGLTPYFSAIYNDGNTDDIAGSYQIQVSASSTNWATSSLVWDSSKTALSSSTPVNTRSPNITYGGTSIVFNGATYYWRIKFWDSADAEGDWSTTTASFSLQGLPPTTNYSNCFSAQVGSSSPSGIKCGSPFFSTLKPANTGTSEFYRIQVSTTSSFSSLLWDTGSSGKDLRTVQSGSRTQDLAYRGSPISFGGNTYYWRIKLWNNGVESGWSTTTDSFTTVSSHVLQNLNYTYDPVGNITRIADNSDTSDARYVDYAYDDLDRLLSASSTNAATGSDYNQTFTYDKLGNITYKSDKGSYGYSGAGYANPHAVTSIGSVTYSYDNNGNLTGTNAGMTNTWDYRNRLVYSANGTATTTDAYDHAGLRVKFSNGTSTTYYPNDIYSVTGATSTKYIYANSQLVASVQGSGANASVMYVNTDHLTGSNIVTDSSGQVVENMDYYPYGSVRVDDKTSGFDLKKKFTGHEYDADTGFNYMNARYQDPIRGSFISQDPSFIAVGDDKKFKGLTNQELKEQLADPQELNSYSYARNNPLKNIDVTGNTAIPVGIIGPVSVGFDSISVAALGSVSIAAIPYVAIGAVIIASPDAFNWAAADPIIQSTPSMRIQSGQQWGGRYGGQVPILDPGKMGFGQPPMGPEDWMPNLNPNNLPSWAKAAVVGGVVGSAVTEYYNQYQDQKQSAQSLNDQNKLKSDQSNIQNSSLGGSMMIQPRNPTESKNNNISK